MRRPLQCLVCWFFLSFFLLPFSLFFFPTLYPLFFSYLISLLLYVSHAWLCCVFFAFLIIPDQLKILTTALFSVLLMKKRLTIRKWRALLLLVFGVIVIVLNADQQGTSPAPHVLLSSTPPPVPGAQHLRSRIPASSARLVSSSSRSSPLSASTLSEVAAEISSSPSLSTFLTGVVSVLMMSSLSGFSGVFFERILKSDLETTIWDRNIQLR